MKEERQRALQAETEFLTGVEANLEQAKGRDLIGTIWQTVRADASEQLRSLMVDRGLYDRDLFKELPQNRRVMLHGYERRWWGGKRRTGVAVASTLAPLEAYLADDGDAQAEPPAVGLDELVQHVRELVAHEKVPHLIGVCSPTGFAPEALDAGLDLPGVTLILVEPRADGGWKTHAGSSDATGRICRLFDPEATSRKFKRVRGQIDLHSADLLGSGISARTVAAELDLPPALVAQAFEQACRADSELRISRAGGEPVLFRGAPVSGQEDAPMSMVDRIRQLFGAEGNEAKKINVLSERRVSLSQRRDRIYEDIAQLEKKENDLVEQGKATKSQVSRRRIAAQVAQLRKDIGRQNTTASMLNQQINIISTHIHNLTLTQQGEMAKLPEAEELTEVAVEAEEMIESLRADADLVDTLESGVADTMASDDELAILQEFEDTQADTARTSGESARADTDTEATDRAAKSRQRDEPEAN